MCKSCRSDDTKALYAKDRAHHAAVKRAWRQANPEKSKAAGRTWRAKNPLKVQLGKIKSKYGLLPGDFAVMYTMQNGNCAICGEPEETAGTLHVDHCHKTGEVRALLCGGCNTSLGGFKDSPALLILAAKYLEHFR